MNRLPFDTPSADVLRALLPQPSHPCVPCCWDRHDRCAGEVLRYVVLNDDRPQLVPCACPCR